ncbi:DUF3618 domain-containing protein [Streptomyces sp. MP131-18]|uniref:DUF3618 domain-containing protein n=1 Tax=Streptomyces sp. MP131-18 TaxID=1857892 RepID=UPI00117CB8C3|nr:DUF3618 domain-containing protein [Streptomyces sp. MP131-18]
MPAGQPASTSSTPSPSAPSPAPVALSIEAEILTCADTGRPELVVSANGASYEARTPEELRAEIAAARDRLTRLDALADQYEALTSPPASPCFSWCDHPSEFPGEHMSAKAHLPIPTGLDVERAELLSVAVAADDYTVDSEPEVLIGHAGDMLALPGDRAERFAGQLIDFANEVLAAVRRTTEKRLAV